MSGGKSMGERWARANPGPRSRARWELLARESQLTPAGEWNVWLFMAGRGAGKTRAAAEDMAYYGLTHPGARLAVVAPTFGDCRDTCVEGESGLLACLPREEVRTWNRSLGEVLLVNGTRYKLFSSDEPERLRGPQFHRAWCVSVGTPVRTPGGEVPIERIEPGDSVMTSKGPRRVLSVGSRMAVLYRLCLADGRELVGSADHPVATTGGWKALGSVTSNDIIWVWRGDGMLGRTGMSSVTRAGASSFSIASSGRSTTARSRRVATFTTSTESEPTTVSRTFGSSPRRSTGRSTAETSNAPTPALSAAPSSSRASSMAERSTAHCLAAPRSRNEIGGSLLGPASSAGSRSGPVMAAIAASGASTLGAVGRVISLEVEDVPEFFADGVLTHNCDELAAFRDPETWDMLQMGLRLGERPQTVATTTPRPTRLMRALLERGDLYLTTGTTWDNAANLAPAALESLQRSYGGTRRGRQELEGELLEDLEGALFKPAWIDDARRRRPNAPLRAHVLGLDPADGLEEGDEQGSALVGVDLNGDLYVVDSWGHRDTPAVWLEWAVRKAQEHSAVIVVEKNHGAAYLVGLLETVMRDIGIRAPYKTVTASVGKRTRAEPVALLYEQGKVCHLGVLPELESQLTNFDASGPSPDRADACVWAISEAMGYGSAGTQDGGGAVRWDARPEAERDFGAVGWR